MANGKLLTLITKVHFMLLLTLFLTCAFERKQKMKSYPEIYYLCWLSSLMTSFWEDWMLYKLRELIGYSSVWIMFLKASRTTECLFTFCIHVRFLLSIILCIWKELEIIKTLPYFWHVWDFSVVSSYVSLKIPYFVHS